MNKLLTKVSLGTLTFATPAVAFAQERGVNLENLISAIAPIQVGSNFTLASFFESIFLLLITISAIVAILYLIWAGIMYITASTDEEKAKKARTAIYNAIIGIIIIVLSYAIIITVGNLVAQQGGNITNGGSLDGSPADGIINIPPPQ